LDESAAKMHLSNLVAFIAINLSVKLETEDLKLVFNVINSTLSVSCLQQIKQLSELIKEVFIIIFFNFIYGFFYFIYGFIFQNSTKIKEIKTIYFNKTTNSSKIYFWPKELL
jgi:hypothetical protein